MDRKIVDSEQKNKINLLFEFMQEELSSRKDSANKDEKEDDESDISIKLSKEEFELTNLAFNYLLGLKNDQSSSKSGSKYKKLCDDLGNHGHHRLPKEDTSLPLTMNIVEYDGRCHLIFELKKKRLVLKDGQLVAEKLNDVWVNQGCSKRCKNAFSFDEKGRHSWVSLTPIDTDKSFKEIREQFRFEEKIARTIQEKTGVSSIGSYAISQPYISKKFQKKSLNDKQSYNNIPIDKKQFCLWAPEARMLNSYNQTYHIDNLLLPPNSSYEQRLYLFLQFFLGVWATHTVGYNHYDIDTNQMRDVITNVFFVKRPITDEHGRCFYPKNNNEKSKKVGYEKARKDYEENGMEKGDKKRTMAFLSLSPVKKDYYWSLYISDFGPRSHHDDVSNLIFIRNHDLLENVMRIILTPIRNATFSLKKEEEYKKTLDDFWKKVKDRSYKFKYYEDIWSLLKKHFKEFSQVFKLLESEVQGLMQYTKKYQLKRSISTNPRLDIDELIKAESIEYEFLLEKVLVYFRFFSHRKHCLNKKFPPILNLKILEKLDDDVLKKNIIRAIFEAGKLFGIDFKYLLKYSGKSNDKVKNMQSLKSTYNAFKKDELSNLSENLEEIYGLNKGKEIDKEKDVKKLRNVAPIKDLARDDSGDSVDQVDEKIEENGKPSLEKNANNGSLTNGDVVKTGIVFSDAIQNKGDKDSPVKDNNVKNKKEIIMEDTTYNSESGADEDDNEIIKKDVNKFEIKTDGDKQGGNNKVDSYSGKNKRKKGDAVNSPLLQKETELTPINNGLSSKKNKKQVFIKEEPLSLRRQLLKHIGLTAGAMFVLTAYFASFSALSGAKGLLMFLAWPAKLLLSGVTHSVGSGLALSSWGWALAIFLDVLILFMASSLVVGVCYLIGRHLMQEVGPGGVKDTQHDFMRVSNYGFVPINSGSIELGQDHGNNNTITRIDVDDNKGDKNSMT